jgi:hypothetical protein
MRVRPVGKNRQSEREDGKDEGAEEKAEVRPTVSQVRKPGGSPDAELPPGELEGQLGPPARRSSPT